MISTDVKLTLYCVATLPLDPGAPVAPAVVHRVHHSPPSLLCRLKVVMVAPFGGADTHSTHFITHKPLVHGTYFFIFINRWPRRCSVIDAPPLIGRGGPLPSLTHNTNLSTRYNTVWVGSENTQRDEHLGDNTALWAPHTREGAGGGTQVGLGVVRVQPQVLQGR